MTEIKKMIKPQVTYEDFEKMILTGGFLFTFRQFISNIHKKYYNQDESCRYLSKSNRIPEFHFSSFLSNQIVINRNNIPNKILIINALRLNKSLGKAILVPTNGIANQAADKLIANPENALRYGRNFFLII